MRRVGALLLAALVPVAAAQAAGPRLTVFAAASLSEALPKVDRVPRYSFAGSDQLAFQIRQGAPADVYAAASPKYPQELYRDGLVEKPVTFATNRLVVIVPRANPARIRSVYDLRRDGIKLVIGAKGVPIGDYTRTVLARLGLSGVLDNVVSEETDVKLIAGKVALGEADAGFVYRTDVRPINGKVLQVPIPASAQPVVEYQIAVVAASRQKAAARSFVRRLTSPRGRSVLRATGFGLP